MSTYVNSIYITKISKALYEICRALCSLIILKSTHKCRESKFLLFHLLLIFIFIALKKELMLIRCNEFAKNLYEHFSNKHFYTMLVMLTTVAVRSSLLSKTTNLLL